MKHSGQTSEPNLNHSRPWFDEGDVIFRIHDVPNTMIFGCPNWIGVLQNYNRNIKFNLQCRTRKPGSMLCCYDVPIFAKSFPCSHLHRFNISADLETPFHFDQKRSTVVVNAVISIFDFFNSADTSADFF